MVKKLLLGLILLSALAAVGYLSALRGTERSKKEYQAGLQQGTARTSEYQKRSDSLAGLLKDADNAAQSLRKTSASDRAVSDSLEALVAIRDSQITQLRSRQKVAQAARTGSALKKPDASDLKNRHVQILEYYKKRLESLPADLSPYERKAAISEVRQETTRKFSISEIELDRLRKSSKLND